MKIIYISDLDGTLLNSDQRTSQFTDNVINGLIDCGGLFSFTTVRSEETATFVIKGIKINAPPIFYNGAVIGYAHSELLLLRLKNACGVTSLSYSATTKTTLNFSKPPTEVMPLQTPFLN